MKQHAAPFEQRLVSGSEHVPLSPWGPPPVSTCPPLSCGACASLPSTGGELPASWDDPPESSSPDTWPESVCPPASPRSPAPLPLPAVAQAPAPTSTATRPARGVEIIAPPPVQHGRHAGWP